MAALVAKKIAEEGFHVQCFFTNIFVYLQSSFVYSTGVARPIFCMRQSKSAIAAEILMRQTRNLNECV